MSVQTRDRILAEAERLFGQQGFAATRLASIASAAGLGNAGLLHHFRSKAALYRAVLDDIASDVSKCYVVDDASADAMSKLDALINGLLSLHRARPNAMAIIAHEFLDQSGRIESAEFLPLASVVEDTIAILEAGQHAGTVRPGNPIAMAAALHGVLIIGCLGRTVYRRTAGVLSADEDAPDVWETELARSARASVLFTD
ncbi:MAG: helix-turn-helix domain-containing protein [Chloroflexota bacterium]